MHLTCAYHRGEFEHSWAGCSLILFCRAFLCAQFSGLGLVSEFLRDEDTSDRPVKGN